MTQESTPAMLEHWKNLLGLQSWDIRVKTEPKGERKGDAEGFIRPQIERADLVIFWGDEESDPFELKLIHELVHVRLWAIDPYEAEGALHCCREVAVEWLARALYASRYDEKCCLTGPGPKVVCELIPKEQVVL